MQKKTVLVLTVQDAKDAMVRHFTNFLISNPAHLSMLIREGRLNEFPNLNDTATLQLVDMFRDNQVGVEFALREGVDLVAVAVTDTMMQVVYEKPAPSSPTA